MIWEVAPSGTQYGWIEVPVVIYHDSTDRRDAQRKAIDEVLKKIYPNCSHHAIWVEEQD